MHTVKNTRLQIEKWIDGKKCHTPIIVNPVVSDNSLAPREDLEGQRIPTFLGVNQQRNLGMAQLEAGTRTRNLGQELAQLETGKKKLQAWPEIELGANMPQFYS